MAPGKRATDQIAKKVRASFERQGFMATLGAELTLVERGEVHIEVACRAGLAQQHGYLHGGVSMALIDTACGYAAISMAEGDMEVLTVELKVNLLAPAVGDRLRAVGRVLRPGRTLTVCQGDGFAITAQGEKHVATLLATMMTVALPATR
ncbi:MAG: PaaI family thioesterase [Acidimicrobiales bacterium]